MTAQSTTTTTNDDFCRPSYDQTAYYAESYNDEADYIRLESELRGIAAALYELGLDSVDESGDDVGDNVDNWNLD